MIYIIIAILVITNAVCLIRCICLHVALRGIIHYLREAGIQPPDREKIKRRNSMKLLKWVKNMETKDGTFSKN